MGSLRDGEIGSGKALRLLWLEPWDGVEQLKLPDVHPLALEVTRRVRIVSAGSNTLRALRAGSKSARIDAKNARGNVRDPWGALVLRESEADGQEGDGGETTSTPSESKGKGATPKGGMVATALCATRRSLRYQNVAQILFNRERYTLPLLARAAPSDDDEHPYTLIAQVLVSSNNKTDGLLRREIVMPASVISGAEEQRERVARRSLAMLLVASKAWSSVVRWALICRADGSPEPRKDSPAVKASVEQWDQRWQTEVDEAFFGSLFGGLSLDDDRAEKEWLRVLGGIALRLLKSADLSMICRGGDRAFAAGRSRGALAGGWKKHFGVSIGAPGGDSDLDDEGQHLKGEVTGNG